MTDEIRVLPQAALIDPYFADGSFLVPAPMGQRTRIRTEIRRLAETASPPLRILVNSAEWFGRPDCFYVLVIG